MAKKQAEMVDEDIGLPPVPSTTGSKIVVVRTTEAPRPEAPAEVPAETVAETVEPVAAQSAPAEPKKRAGRPKGSPNRKRGEAEAAPVNQPAGQMKLHLNITLTGGADHNFIFDREYVGPVPTGVDRGAAIIDVLETWRAALSLTP